MIIVTSPPTHSSIQPLDPSVAIPSCGLLYVVFVGRIVPRYCVFWAFQLCFVVKHIWFPILDYAVWVISLLCQIPADIFLKYFSQNTPTRLTKDVPIWYNTVKIIK